MSSPFMGSCRNVFVYSVFGKLLSLGIPSGERTVVSSYLNLFQELQIVCNFCCISSYYKHNSFKTINRCYYRFVQSIMGNLPNASTVVKSAWPWIWRPCLSNFCDWVSLSSYIFTVNLHHPPILNEVPRFMFVFVTGFCAMTPMRIEAQCVFL